LENPFSIDFEQIKNVAMKRWALLSSRIFISYNEKGAEKEIKFTGLRYSLMDSPRTKLIYETIDKLFKKQQPDLEKIAKAKSGDVMPPHLFNLISFVVVLVGWLGGGLVGLLIAMLLMYIIRKIGLNEEYSLRKKLVLTGLAIVFGIVLYFVLLNILLIILT